MIFCVECVLPDTKPDLQFDESGRCSACSNFRARATIDWEGREAEFVKILSNSRESSQSAYDCVIPVSGGKDSTYQVLKLLDLGANPLAVTATTCDLTPVGQRNIENIKNLGVDHITVSPNPVIRRKLNRIGLERVGDIAWPEHVGIFTAPVRVAVQFGISLIVWGENSQNEYGGPEQAVDAKLLNRRWLEEFGGLLGLRVSDLPDGSDIAANNLYPYTYPSESELTAAKLSGVFLGHFFPWDGLSNYLVSQAHGFESYGKKIEGSMVDYENLDNFQHGIHDYFKFLKFGFGRATDIASLHVRRGRISRKDACQIVAGSEGKFPWSYLGKPLEEILSPLHLDIDAFQKICDSFTNKKLFEINSEGSLIKDSEGNLIRRFSPA